MALSYSNGYHTGQEQDVLEPLLAGCNAMTGARNDLIARFQKQLGGIIRFSRIATDRADVKSDCLGVGSRSPENPGLVDLHLAGP